MSDFKSQYGYNEFGASEYGGAVTVTESPTATASVSSNLELTSRSIEAVETNDVFIPSVTATTQATDFPIVAAHANVVVLESADGSQSEAGSISITAGGPNSVIETATVRDLGTISIHSPLRLNASNRAYEYAENESSVFASPIISLADERIPLFESTEITATPQFGLYKSIYISESPSLVATHKVDSKAPTFSTEDPNNTTGLILSTTTFAESVENNTEISISTPRKLLDTSASAEYSTNTFTIAPSASIFGTITEGGVIPIWGGSNTTDHTRTSDSPIISTHGVFTAVDSTRSHSGQLIAKSGSESFLIDTANALGSVKQTNHAEMTTSASAAAQHVVAMSAGVHPYNTDTAYVRPALSVGKHCSVGSVDSARSMDSGVATIAGVYHMGERSGARDVLLTTNPKSSEVVAEFAESVDAVTTTGGFDADSVGRSHSIDTAELTGTLDPASRPLGLASATSESHPVLETEIKDVGVDATEYSYDREAPGITGFTQMSSPTWASGSDRATITDDMTSVVLEGSAGVQTEMVLFMIGTGETMSATGASFSSDSADSTASSPATVIDTGVATQTDMGVSESVELSNTEDGSADESPTTEQPTSFTADGFAPVIDMPETITSSRVVFLDESGVAVDLGSVEFSEVYNEVDYAYSTDAPEITSISSTLLTSAEYAPTDEVLSFQLANPMLANGTVNVDAHVETIDAESSTSAPDSARAVETPLVPIAPLIWSSSTIPGLRRTITILEREKGFVYDRAVGASRSVEVGDATSGSVELGPLNELLIRRFSNEE